MARQLFKCEAKGCRNRFDKKKHKNRLCPKHAHRRWKERHPFAFHFNKLKYRAKERGIEFTLTLAQYTEFAKKNDLERMRGKTSLSLSVDRKDPRWGYHDWNIKAITIAENSRKQWTDMPLWMRDEAKRAAAGFIPETHLGL